MQDKEVNFYFIYRVEKEKTLFVYGLVSGKTENSKNIFYLCKFNYDFNFVYQNTKLVENLNVYGYVLNYRIDFSSY